MVTAARRTLGRRALAVAIAGYSRWLSGRGPLRRVRCTFHHGESCSAYGRRIAAEAGGLWPALAAIRRRLHRCADASLYLLPDDALGWGPAYDRPLAPWLAELDRDRELPTTRDALLRARAAVARWRGDRRELTALAALPAPASGPRLIVRRAPLGHAGHALRPLVRPTLIALALIALTAMVAPFAVTVALAAALAVALAGRAGRLRGRARRWRWQATAAAISRAGPTPARAGAASPAPARAG